MAALAGTYILDSDGNVLPMLAPTKSLVGYKMRCFSAAFPPIERPMPVCNQGTDIALFFLSNEMSGLSVEAGKDNKGFYSPTEYGYNFADVYMPLGTLTDWAHEESIHFTSSRESIGPRYIDLQKEAIL